MSSRRSLARPLVSLPQDRLERLARFFQRLAELEDSYRPLLRDPQSLVRASLDFQSSVHRACEQLLNGSSQEERQAYRLLQG